MALSKGVNPKFGVGGFPVPTGAPTSSNVAQTSDGMNSGFLDPVLTRDYFAQVEKVSVIQQIAQKIPMGPTGVRIPHWTGNVTAKWVAEGGQKPVTRGDFSKQDVVPYKIATIFVASAEQVRANPHNYLSVMRTKVGEAIALSFDNAVMNDVDNPFGKALSQTSSSVSLADPLGAGKDAKDGSNAYTALNNGLQLLLTAGKKWTGTLFDDKAEPILNGAVDTAQRPLFIDATYQDINAPFRAGRVLGRPTYVSDHVSSGTTIGYMGDFSQIVWGQVGNVSYDVSDQATLDLSVAQDGSGITSLWQNNLVAVRVEAEFACLINDVASFVKLTNVVTP